MGRVQSPAGGSPLNTAAVPKRRVIDVCKDAIGLLCEGLHALGDRHAIFGFSGDGREQVDFYVAKTFDEGWGVHAAARLAAMQPKGGTRTGAAVRHALHLLAREPARRRILVVLSDGYPQDADYHAHRNRPDLPEGHEDRAYGLHDTARALQEAERAGVAAFNLSVDAAANDYLRQMCPKHRYWAIDDVEALPRQMLALYRSMAV
jgi:nitric oxide reductase NorD protein